MWHAVLPPSAVIAQQLTAGGARLDQVLGQLVGVQGAAKAGLCTLRQVRAEGWASGAGLQEGASWDACCSVLLTGACMADCTHATSGKRHTEREPPGSPASATMGRK